MLKSFNVSVGLKEKIFSPTFHISQNDQDSVELIVTIYSTKDIKQDLTGKTVRLAVQKPSNLTVFQDCTVTDALNGVATVILTNQAYIETGEHSAEIYVYEGVTVSVSDTFNFMSESAILNDETVESANEWTAINDALVTYDLKPLIVQGTPTVLPEYIGRIALDTTTNNTYIATNLETDYWRILGGGSGGGGVVYWADILNKPTAFVPTIHRHDWTEIDNKPLTFPVSVHTHLWAEITDKPSTFVPSVHTHAWTEVTGKPTVFAPSAHTHLWADLTDKPVAFNPTAHSHNWVDIYNRPATYAPSAHVHAIADITDLQAQLNSKLSSVPAEYLTQTEGDARYDLKGSATQPRTGTVDPSGAPNYIGEIYINTTTSEAWIAGSSAGNWQTISADEAGGGSGSVDWTQVTNKPSTFPPSAHTHLWAEISDRPTTMTPTAHTHLWADITDRPSSMTPTAHTHLWADITDKPATFTPPLMTTALVGGARTGNGLGMSGEYLYVKTDTSLAIDANYALAINRTTVDAWYAFKTHTHLWAEITDKPTTFTPAVHTHLWADLTDKPSTFPPSVHTHAIADVTNLETTLNAKAEASALNGLKLWSGTQTTYDGLVKDPNTLYFITGA